MSARVEIRNGVTVRVRALGPVMLALPSGTGPFAFIDFRLPAGGYSRVFVTTDGVFSFKPGTGTNYTSRIDLQKSGGGVVGVRHDGKQFAQVAGQGLGLSHIDLIAADGSIWRVTVAANGDFNFSKQATP